jgi:4-amino-4-deoxy-L-arabinose transferase-like glycosyltransferase
VKLFHRELWGDEFYQLGQMKGAFLDMIKGFPENEFCSYLSGDYYLTYPFFKIFSYNKWGLAIPHIISTLIGFYLLYLLCCRYFKSIWGYIITFSIICFNATMIYHATEIRAYAVLPTLALSCLYFWLKLIDLNYCLSKIRRIAIGVFFVLSIWFHAYGILIFFFTGFYALITKLKDKLFFQILRNTVLFVFFVACAALPIWYLSIFGPRLTSIQFNIDTFQYIPNPLENSIGFLKGIFGNLVGYKKLYFLLLGMIFPFLIPYRDRFQQIALLVVLVFIPIGVILGVAVFTHYWFIQRLFVWVIPFFALFIGWSWDSSISYFQEKLEKLRVTHNVRKN